jgi:hypothetical protein
MSATILTAVVTVLLALAFDFAFRFQLQLFFGISSHGERPKSYRFGPWYKAVALIMALIPLNLMIDRQIIGVSVEFLAFTILALIYLGCASYSSLKDMRDVS